MKYKCKECKGNGWYPTKKGSIVEMRCFICNGKGEVDEETAIERDYIKPKRKYKK